MTANREWRFSAFDTWFFRESRPIDSVGASELTCSFPPPVRTLLGAIRTTIGEHVGLDWARHLGGDGRTSKHSGLDMIDQIGDANGAGRLVLAGPYLLHGGEPIYRMPRHVMRRGSDRFLLELGPPVACDLGVVRLPRIPDPPARDERKVDALDDAWLARHDLERVLSGQPPQTIVERTSVFTEEPRLGIARSRRSKTVEKGALYQTRHVRLGGTLDPRVETEIAVEVGGIDERLHPDSAVIRLGGEGRPAHIEVRAVTSHAVTLPRIAGRGCVLCLLTDADFGESWLPPGFSPVNHQGVTAWKGMLSTDRSDRIPLTIHGAVIGRVVREGGWDMKSQAPRAVHGYVPAGSVYFCTTENRDAAEVAARLHGARAGHQVNLGRGEIAVGTWNAQGVDT